MARKIDGRLAYADLLRTFATIAVIVLHLAGSQMAVVAVTSQNWQIFNIYDGLVRWCVPVFVMLSGMFMLDPGRSLPLPKLLFHNALRILVCLMFWGTVYALAGCWAAGDFSVHGLWTAMLDTLKGNTHYHLWFLYMILGLYLVTPILRAFCKGASRGDLHYFFILAFLFASLLPISFQLWPGLYHWQADGGCHLYLRGAGRHCHRMGYGCPLPPCRRAGGHLIWLLLPQRGRLFHRSRCPFPVRAGCQ